MYTAVHKATSAAPDIDRVLDETRRTPFTDRIANAKIKDTGKMRFPEYNGTADPLAHLRAFRLSVARAHLNDEEKERKGPYNFQELGSVFLKHYSVFITSKATEADLWTCRQNHQEPLRAYLARFKEIKSRITDLNEGVALSALKHGLWFDSPFRHELSVRCPETIDDALHRAPSFAQYEEEQNILQEQYEAGLLVPSSATTKKAAKKEPGGKGIHTFTIDSSSKKESKKEKNSTYEANKFCTHHNKKGHSTEEYRTVLAEKAKLAAKTAEQEGEPAGKNEEPENSKTSSKKRDRAPTDENPSSPPAGPKKRIDLIFRGITRCGGSMKSVISPPPAPKKDAKPQTNNQLVEARKSAKPELPKFQGILELFERPKPKRINFISGGSKHCRNSVNSIKAYQRRVETNMRERAPLQGPNHKVVFLESETLDLDKPLDDALVVRLDVGGCELSRIMIDTGSSVDVLFYNAYKQMGFGDDILCGTKSPLTGFAGETTYSMGTITLLVVAGGVLQLTVFEVVDRSAPYNAILGRPWLYNMRAIPSTYYQCVKFPTAEGVKTVHGSQRASRICYMTGHKQIEQSPL
ncbi:uncharacterized protein LOC112087579 [Eutrema salsugineum]|uniref:uncharacterized protein LOC112087579 n=1 Tax=Eutrema salsugineum TaxID=72664 RepID=UPI000CECEEB0|nr:uncharacterized protein LOC112087579 [Eutrema salsugineum]